MNQSLGHALKNKINHKYIIIEKSAQNDLANSNYYYLKYEIIFFILNNHISVHNSSANSSSCPYSISTPLFELFC